MDAEMETERSTDRPPDIPYNAVGVFAGCLQERAGTRYCRLALIARGSHCSSGNVTPLAANASWFLSGSRAGCFRSVVGSGSTGYVCGFMSPFPKPGSQYFSSAEVFLPHSSQRVQWHSATTVASRILTCTTPQAAPRAVVRCSQVPRWGQTK
jgi:hypothetical protein